MSATAVRLADLARQQQHHLSTANGLPRGSAERERHMEEYDRIARVKIALRDGQPVRESSRGEPREANDSYVARPAAPPAASVEQVLIAHHESSHTVCAWILGDTAVSATIVPEPGVHRGCCNWSGDASPRDKATILA